MEEELQDVIFDPSLQLPSIEGIQSSCEEELHLLMKEVNLAFVRKHKDLLKEMEHLKSSNQEKSTAIDSLNLKLRKAQNKQLEEQIKLSKEVEKLKEENSRLKRENSDLQRRVPSNSENMQQSESLKRSLVMQQEENVLLKERLSKLSEKHNILQENYQRLLNLMTSDSKENKPEEDAGALDEFIQRFIAQESENYIQDEINHCDRLQTKICNQIDEFQKTFQEGT